MKDHGEKNTQEQAQRLREAVERAMDEAKKGGAEYSPTRKELLDADKNPK